MEFLLKIKSYENAVLFFPEAVRIDKNFAAAYPERCQEPFNNLN